MTLIGRLSRSLDSLSGTLSSGGTLVGSLDRTTEKLSGVLTHPSDMGIEVYEGEYVIDSDVWDDMMLPTKKKLLTDDITINKVRYIETLNPSGGQTVYIG